MVISPFCFVVFRQFNFNRWRLPCLSPLPLPYSKLKSTNLESLSIYQISSDNPQKDTFHNLVFDIDKTVAFDILDPTILTKFLSRKGWWMGKNL